MTVLLLIAVFLVAALSLLSYLYCWQDIRNGEPHIISLRQIMSIMDRDILNRHFGTPRPGYYYTLSPEHIRYVVQRRRWFFYRECLTDIVCMLGAWFYLTGGSHTGILHIYLFILLASLCQAINIIHSFWLIHKWRDQISEEIENSDD